MSKMTRKQVAAFVDNDDNWTIIPGNDYIKLGTLDFGDLHYAVIFAREICNTLEIIRNGEAPRYKWRREFYYEYDPATKGLTYSTSNTHVKDKVYEEANK